MQVEAYRIDGDVGSSMMGGGFGGCMINLAHRSRIPHVQEQLEAHYMAETSIRPSIFPVELSDGVSVVR